MHSCVCTLLQVLYVYMYVCMYGTELLLYIYTSVSRANLSTAPVFAAVICHGTRLLWCSIVDSTISSPAIHIHTYIHTYINHHTHLFYYIHTYTHTYKNIYSCIHTYTFIPGNSCIALGRLYACAMILMASVAPRVNTISSLCCAFTNRCTDSRADSYNDVALFASAWAPVIIQYTKLMPITVNRKLSDHARKTFLLLYVCNVNMSNASAFYLYEHLNV